MNKLILVLALLFLSGCEGIKVEQHGYQGGSIYVPKEEFNENEVKSRAAEVCQSQNMTLNRVVPVSGVTWVADNTPLGYKYFNYFCDPVTPINSRANEQKRVEKIKDELNAEPKKDIQNALKTEPTKRQTMGINEAKEKCTELGFKPKTEKFGMCVLDLTK